MTITATSVSFTFESAEAEATHSGKKHNASHMVSEMDEASRTMHHGIYFEESAVQVGCQ